MNKNVTIAGKSFEDLKQINEHGAEYWSARALQFLLGYSQWRRFEQAIDRAISSCKESGNPPENHFAGAGKMVLRGISRFFARTYGTIDGLLKTPPLTVAQ